LPEHLGFEVPHESQTEEERKKIFDDKKLKISDWYKKSKKKPKTEEEDVKDAEDIKHKIITHLTHIF
jgi:hypothetical protein